MVVRYEHASEERNALLVQDLHAMTQSENVTSIGQPDSGDGTRRLRMSQP